MESWPKCIVKLKDGTEIQGELAFLVGKTHSTVKFEKKEGKVIPGAIGLPEEKYNYLTVLNKNLVIIEEETKKNKIKHKPYAKSNNRTIPQVGLQSARNSYAQQSQPGTRWQNNH